MKNKSFFRVDVLVLAGIYSRFDSTFRQKFGSQFYPIISANSIASLCAQLYRSKFLNGELMLIGDFNLNADDRSSKLGEKYCSFLAKSQVPKIQYALTDKEHILRPSRIKPDGYDPETDTSYFVHGCLYHSHDKCQNLDPSVKNPLRPNLTHRQIWEEELLARAKTQKLCSRQKIIWECEILRELRKNKEMADWFRFYEKKMSKLPKRTAAIRDSVFGGRVEALALSVRLEPATSSWRMRFRDIVSY